MKVRTGAQVLMLKAAEMARAMQTPANQATLMIEGRSLKSEV
jgi:hypothetical protein